VLQAGVKPQTKRGDVLAILLAAVVGLFMLSLPFWVPSLPRPQHPPNWGFNPDWNCTNPGIEPVCI
jgi:hypothetical protein